MLNIFSFDFTSQFLFLSVFIVHVRFIIKRLRKGLMGVVIWFVPCIVWDQQQAISNIMSNNYWKLSSFTDIDSFSARFSDRFSLKLAKKFYSSAANKSPCNRSCIVSTTCHILWLHISTVQFILLPLSIVTWPLPIMKSTKRVSSIEASFYYSWTLLL